VRFPRSISNTKGGRKKKRGGQVLAFLLYTARGKVREKKEREVKGAYPSSKEERREEGENSHGHLPLRWGKGD